ncbi:MAG: hypothetical protein KKC46_04020 [Proteobacteria bacterium]|nr:hypothetical protein [Pseudomonadota bacterium]
MSLILHTYSDPNGTVRDSFVKPLENNTANKTRPYYDGSIAIGYGFDLLVRTDSDINKYLTTTNTKLNLPVNQQISLPGSDAPLLSQARGYAIQIKSLELQAKTATPQQLIIINQQISSLRQQIYNNSQLLSLRLPDEPYAAKLLNILLNEYETALDTALGYCLAKSKEKTAILSLLYTMTIPSVAGIRNKIPATLAAINNENRAEAWYEIRYGSNKGGGHTNRRYIEANEFGLYDDGVLTADQTKEIMRMYTRYEYEGLGSIKLSAYELPSKYPPPSGIQNINDSIKAASDYLVLNLAKGKTIDGWVIVGRGLDSYDYIEKNWADIIIGTNKNDLIFGEKGSDIIDGSTGDDVIYGGDGKDDLNGGDGEDILIGGDGNDVLEGGKGNDILEGGLGNDDYYFQSGDGNDTITDTDGENRIFWTDSNGIPHLMKTFYKSGDAEWKSPDGTVEVNKHSPYKIVLPDGGTITLGEDFQPGDFGIQLKEAPQVPNTTKTILGDQYPEDLEDVLTGTTGNDRIEGRDGDDTISSLQGDDMLLGGTGRDAISAGEGNDVLEGGTGSDILFGEEGNDQIFGENAGSMSDLISAGENATSINQTGDLIVGNEGDDQLYGSNSNDALLGGEGHDLLAGGGGNDVIYGDYNSSGAYIDWDFEVTPDKVVSFTNVNTNPTYFQGDDEIYGGSGDDIVVGGGGDDLIYGGSDNDFIVGDAGDDTIFGGTGNDILLGENDGVPDSEQGEDYIDGGSGNDEIYGGGKSDTLIGGDGNDYIQGDYNILNSGGDFIDGGDGNDVILGYGGNDWIYGGEGDDWLQGDDGDDYIDGGLGADTIAGGSGKDWIFGNAIGSYTGEDYSIDTIDAGADDDFVQGGDGADIILGGTGNDEIYGGGGNDELQGNDGNDIIFGETGDDIIFGLSGNDTIYGGEDNDILYGGAGNDILYGEEGDDILSGGNGFDILFGGSGNDTLLYENIYGSGDVIMDGEDGDDTYIYNPESGKNVHVNDNFYNDSEHNKIVIQGNDNNPNITTDDISYKYKGGRLNRYIELGSRAGIFGSMKIHTTKPDGTNLDIDISGMAGRTIMGLDEFIASTLNSMEVDYNNAGTALPPRRRDPLILDLDGDGIESTRISTSTHFDHDGDGFAERTGWVDKDDGLLVRDINNDGIINDGSELFGDNTNLETGIKAANGFEALSELDENNDGIIDANDSMFEKLRVWQDINKDCVSSADELHDLNSLGIKAIKLDSEVVNLPDGEGNTITREGTFVRTDDSENTIAEYGLKTNVTHTRDVNLVDIPDEIAVLPDLEGSGKVSDLHQAMVKDASGNLKSLVEQFISAEGVDTRNALMEQILFKWTETDSVAQNSRGAFFDGRKLAIIEAYMGKPFTGANGPNPNSAAGDILDGIYHRISETCYAMLMQQSHLAFLFGQIEYDWYSTKLVDLSSVSATIVNELADDPEKGKELLSEFARTYRATDDTNAIGYLNFREEFIIQDESLGWVIDTGGLPKIDSTVGTNRSEAIIRTDETDSRISGGNGDDVIYGSTLNDILQNNSGDAVLVGGGGNDSIWAGAGDDILDGGEGKDLLLGEGGNDTYIFRLGSGWETINDTDPTEGNTDTLFLGSNISPDDISLRRSGNNLIVEVNNTADKVTVQDYFKNDSPLNRVEQIQFMDGTIWDTDAIAGIVSVPSETDDIIYGTPGDDILHGIGGNDTIYGASGNDELYGDIGNDKIYGNAGEDILDGGEGADTLDGGTGNDTYVFNIGSGQDVINDADTTPGNIDTIIFGEDILSTDIKVERSGNYDIKLSIIGTLDSILLKNCFFYSNGDWHYQTVIEQFRFADDTVWSADTIKDIILTGTDKTDLIGGFSGQDNIYGLGGNDYLNGWGGDDTIEGGSGDDKISGNDGNDTLIGGEGDDILYGNSGNDIYDGGPGDDIIYGSVANGWNYYESMPYTYNGANGDDTYLFGRGDGYDTVVDRDRTPGNIDTILLGSDIVPDDILIQHKKNDLVLTIKDTGDKLTVSNWFFDESSEWQIEHIQFADGTVWDVDAIKAKVLLGTDANDILIGYNTDDIISGFNGTDFLYGRKGNDTISGGDGNDWIYGEAGNDTLSGNEDIDVIYGGNGDDIINGGTGVDYLHGGTGNDTISGDEGDDFLEGNEGSDTFIFKAGSGQDVIRGSDSEVSSIDTILIDEGITTESIQIRRNEDDLVVTKKDTGDSMTVENWFADEGNESEKIDEIRFADGTVWDVAMLKQLALEGTSEAEVLTGYSSDDIMDGKEGDDVLTGKAGNDTYIFGRGYGQDVIYEDYDSSGAYIEWDFEVTPDDITLDQVGNNLVVLPHIMNNSQNSNMHHILLS